VNPRTQVLLQTLDRLGDALAEPESTITRDAAIQRFEFCFELAWRTIQERGRDQGLDCRSPKGCFKLAFKTGWVDSEQGWLVMLEDRNRTSHTYNEALARDVFSRLAGHLSSLRRLAATLTAD